jgi:hypothetical protein
LTVGIALDADITGFPLQKKFNDLDIARVCDRVLSLFSRLMTFNIQMIAHACQRLNGVTQIILPDPEFGLRQSVAWKSFFFIANRSTLASQRHSCHCVTAPPISDMVMQHIFDFFRFVLIPSEIVFVTSVGSGNPLGNCHFDAIARYSLRHECGLDFLKLVTHFSGRHVIQVAPIDKDGRFREFSVSPVYLCDGIFLSDPFICHTCVRQSRSLLLVEIFQQRFHPIYLGMVICVHRTFPVVTLQPRLLVVSSHSFFPPILHSRHETFSIC